jgi:long-chain acyl-CoA synthetase
VVVLADYVYDQKVRELRSSLSVRHYVVASIPEYLGFPLKLLAPLKLRRSSPPLVAKVQYGPEVHSFRRLVRSTPPEVPAADVALEDLAVLQYTGGTTGVSKGAMLTHQNLSFNAQQVRAWFAGLRQGEEVLLVALPLFHVFGLTVAMNFSVLTATKMVLQADPRDVARLVRNIERQGVTIFPAVPAMFNAINHYRGIDSADLSSVTACFSGSAPLPLDVLQRFEELTGSVIVEGFGMTETSPVTHVNPLGGKRKVGTIGVPVPDTDARLVDVETGDAEVSPGSEGELVVRGPQVMRGYWGREEATAEAIRDGWMHTGDLAVQDEDGYFRIVGRKKDMILCGGYNVYPDEVDDVLMAHEAILEAATIGVPDERRGELVKSFVVLKAGAKLTAEEVETHCRANLAAYKIPREVEFLDELPKSSVLKVLRRELRERELQKRGAAG